MNQLTGYVYLRRPAPVHPTAPRTITPEPGPTPPQETTEPRVPAESPAAAQKSAITTTHETPKSPAATPPAEPSTPCVGAPYPVVGRLLTFWLEALAGRRSVKSLQRAPFTPLALADLERTVARERGTMAASGIKSLHIQPGGGDRRTRFCASVVFGNRVRAVVGTLSWRRLDPRIRKPQRTHAWHVEVIQVI